MKAKILGFLYVFHFVLGILQLLSVFYLITTFTKEKWDWGFWKNFIFVPIIFSFIDASLILSSLLLIVPLITVIVQVCTGDYGPMFTPCLVLTIVTATSVVCNLLSGFIMKSLAKEI